VRTLSVSSFHFPFQDSTNNKNIIIDIGQVLDRYRVLGPSRAGEEGKVDRAMDLPHEDSAKGKGRRHLQGGLARAGGHSRSVPTL